MTRITSLFARGTKPAAPQALPAVEVLEERALLDASGYVGNLYTELLHRGGSSGEIAAWVGVLNGGASGEQVARAIANSTEFRSRIVSDDYLRLLGRAPDAAGLNAWVAQLAAGLTPDQIEAALVSSDEYFLRNGNTVAGFLNAAYRDEFGRGPDDAGFAFWSGRLVGGGSRLEAANSFANGPEHHNHEVDDDYQDVLGRRADDAGRDFWRGQLDQGLNNIELLIRLAGSQENGEHAGFEVEPGRRGGTGAGGGGGADDGAGHH
jgi:hypothetical protein